MTLYHAPYTIAQANVVLPTVRSGPDIAWTPYCPDYDADDPTVAAYLIDLEAYRGDIGCDSLDEAFIRAEADREYRIGARTKPPYYQTDLFLDCSLQGTETGIIDLSET